jgi:hypothetical protein
MPVRLEKAQELASRYTERLSCCCVAAVRRLQCIEYGRDNERIVGVPRVDGERAVWANLRKQLAREIRSTEVERRAAIECDPLPQPPDSTRQVFGVRAGLLALADDARRVVVQANGGLYAIPPLATRPAGTVTLFAALFEQPGVVKAQPNIALRARTIPIQEIYFTASDDCRFSRAEPELSHEQVEVPAAQLHQLSVCSFFGDCSFLQEVYTVNVSNRR